jgi:DMSO reductase anchor subunit
MPNSRQRHKHPNHQSQHHVVTKQGAKRSAAFILAVIVGLFGLVIGAFASQSDTMWMLISAAIGIFAGLMIGRGIDRTTAKK